MRTTFVSALAGLVLAGEGVHAFWRLNCNNVLIQERSDPIVFPGTVSAHTHNVVGGSNFGPNSTFESMRESDCTSCMVQQDFSAYWSPQLYFEYANGTFESVALTSQLIYYLQRNNSADTTGVTAFPDGFKLLTGNVTARSYDPDSAMAQMIGWNCLGAADPPDGQTRQPYLPPYDCPDGLRGEVMFPSCWNGKDLDSDDHFSHMAYPIGGEDGPCPEGYPVRLVTLFFEVMYSTDPMKSLWPLAKNTSQPFVLAPGDPTGYAWHGDFINGWDNSVLQDAIDTCTNQSGELTDCPVFDLSSDECRITPHWDEIVVSSDWEIELLDSLPGNNPVQDGPAEATMGSLAPATAFKSVTAYTASVAPPGASILPDQPAVVLQSGDWSYEACYMDSASPRALATSITNDANTVEGALAGCLAAGFTTCGIEFGGQTWSGSAIDSSSYVIGYGNCSMPCTGNAKQLCGGENAMDVYSYKAGSGSATSSGAAIATSTATSTAVPVDVAVTTTAAESSGATAKVTSSAAAAKTSAGAASSSTSTGVVSKSGDYTYQGCYSDSGSPRVLPNSLSNSANTVAGAIAACSSAGFTFCGIEYGGQTWGANSLASNGDKVDDSKCDMACTGDESQLCGGSNALLVYSLDDAAVVVSSAPKVVASSGGWTSKGCYSDSVSARVLTDALTNSNDTVEGALAACSSAGYTYCGVEYGGQTWAANTLSSSAKAEDASECEMVCNGDTAHYCGGSDAIQLYETSGSSASTSSASTSTSTSKGATVASSSFAFADGIIGVGVAAVAAATSAVVRKRMATQRSAKRTHADSLLGH